MMKHPTLKKEDFEKLTEFLQDIDLYHYDKFVNEIGKFDHPFEMELASIPEKIFEVDFQPLDKDLIISTKFECRDAAIHDNFAKGYYQLTVHSIRLKVLDTTTKEVLFDQTVSIDFGWSLEGYEEGEELYKPDDYYGPEENFIQDWSMFWKGGKELPILRKVFEDAIILYNKKSPDFVYY